MRAVVAMIVALAACGGARTRSTTPPVFVVLEPGAEPRQQLRYTPKLRVPQRMEVRLKVRSSAAFTNTVFEKGKLDVDAPTIRLVARLEVTELTPAGDAVISYELEDTSVMADVLDPRLYKVYEPEVAALKGLRGSWRCSPSGQLSHIAMDPEKIKRANRVGLWGIADAVLQATVRFPDAPVGIGAIWRTTYEEEYGAARWNTTVTYRLKNLDGTLATIEVTAAMRAPSQAISVEPNATTRLTSAERNVTQLLVVPLDGLAVSGDGHDTAELDLLIVRGKLRVASTARSETLATFQALASP